MIAACLQLVACLIREEKQLQEKRNGYKIVEAVIIKEERRLTEKRSGFIREERQF